MVCHSVIVYHFFFNELIYFFFCKVFVIFSTLVVMTFLWSRFVGSITALNGHDEKRNVFNYQILTLVKMTFFFSFSNLLRIFYHRVCTSYQTIKKVNAICFLFEGNVEADRIREELLFERITACDCTF